MDSETPGTRQTERRGLMGLVGSACLLFLCGVTVADPDLWGHTLYGLRTIEQGVWVERTDPFSYTAAGAPWINHEWLTELIFAWCWRSGGNLGLVLWRNLLLLLMFGLIARVFANCRVSLSAAWLLLVFNTECLANYVVFVRPQLGTYLGFVTTLVLLRRHWDRPDWTLWLLPLVMLIWTNLHGGFLAGVALVGLFAAAALVRGWFVPDRRQEVVVWLGVAAATVFATLVNPYGVGLHRMLWDHLITPQAVLEWQPVWVATPSAVYAVPFALTAVGLLGSRRWDWIDALVLLLVGWQAASHIRHIALFCLTTFVLLPTPLSEAVERWFPRLSVDWSRPERVWSRWTAGMLIVAFLAGLQYRGVREMWRDGVFPWDVAVETRSGVPGMPVTAVAEMRRRGWHGNLVTDYGWGQFVLWHLFPEVKVAFDGRYRTVYPAEIETQLLALQRAASERMAVTPLLDEYPTNLVLAPVASRLAEYLEQRPDWACQYRDEQAALFVPRQPELAATADETMAHPLVPNSSPPRWMCFPGAFTPSH